MVKAFNSSTSIDQGTQQIFKPKKERRRRRRVPPSQASSTRSIYHRLETINEAFEIKVLLWGPETTIDVFKSWSQGFEFSEAEPTALLQNGGGPCAVLAPVQAYIFKAILKEGLPVKQLPLISTSMSHNLLVKALCDILENCCKDRFKLAVLDIEDPKGRQEKVMRDLVFQGHNVTPEESESDIETEIENITEDDVVSIKAAIDKLNYLRNAGSFQRSRFDLDYSSDKSESTASSEVSRAKITTFSSMEDFHMVLQILEFRSLRKVEEFYKENLNVLTDRYGVLLFVYSVFLTKGLDKVTQELSDPKEPLIHPTFSFASQAFVNLMLTGRAVSEVFDREQVVKGIKLQGINAQSDIGYLSLMECKGLCTVGHFYKNPKYPIWVLASEMHFTTFFCNDEQLGALETQPETAVRVFRSYGPQGKNYIKVEHLEKVMKDLNLYREEEYVKFKAKKLDPQHRGIIDLNDFMDEFFMLKSEPTFPQFQILHYNGIARKKDSHLKYSRGSAILLASDVDFGSSTYPVDLVLQTKWRNIKTKWETIPSLG